MTSQPASTPVADGAVKAKCYTKADGTQVCISAIAHKHNTTDVYSQGGIEDYSNQQSGDESNQYSASVTGQNLTATLDPDAAPPNPKYGNLVVQGATNTTTSSSHDTHNDANNGDSTDHKESDDKTTSDHKAAGSKPDGEKTNLDKQEFDEDRKLSDVQLKNGSSDTIYHENDVDTDHLRFDKQIGGLASSVDPTGSYRVPDSPLVGGDSSLGLDTSKDHDYLQESHNGNGVYDYHSESKDTDTAAFHLGGGGALRGFEELKGKGQLKDLVLPAGVVSERGEGVVGEGGAREVGGVVDGVVFGKVSGSGNGELALVGLPDADHAAAFRTQTLLGRVDHGTTLCGAGLGAALLLLVVGLGLWRKARRISHEHARSCMAAQFDVAKGHGYEYQDSA